VKLILNPKLKYYTKEILKYFNIVIIGIGFIIAIILIKYKPIYKVTILGEEIGYVQNKKEFKESLKTSLIEENKNVDNIELKSDPEYELKLVNRETKTNEEQIASKIEEDAIITYKYYDIALNNETIETVNTIEEAEEIVNQAKNENTEQELDLSILEKYTQNKDEVKVAEIEVAKTDVNNKITETLEKQEAEKQAEEAAKKAQEELDAMPEINGIKIATKPISGTITSRYGESSRLRKSTHTGLDISATTGTDIKAVASGTVTCAKYSGSYGNLVKIDHGNGVETWYGHTSKMYVKVGQEVKAGDVIAAVGSTGNSTGPHLHLEIRINGTHVNPQKYLYN
jgi:murein DD-endopeptidase MepM/ murein hydrolase activator NlpD